MKRETIDALTIDSPYVDIYAECNEIDKETALKYLEDEFIHKEEEHPNGIMHLAISDDDNLGYMWIEDGETIHVSGMYARKGHIETSQELETAKEMRDYFIDAVTSGKEVKAYANNKSIPLLEGIHKRAMKLVPDTNVYIKGNQPDTNGDFDKVTVSSITGNKTTPKIDW